MGGETTTSVDLADVLAVVRDEPRGTPLTTREVAEAASCSRRTAYDKLETLAERGDLSTKKVGARGRVWWRSADDQSTSRESTDGEGGSAAVADGRTDGQSRGEAATDPAPPIAALAASTRPLAETETWTGVGETVVGALGDLTDVVDAVVYRFDTSDNRLVPVARTRRGGDGTGVAPIAAADDSPTWIAFAEGEPCILDPTAAAILADADATDCFECVVPLGEHGIVVAATAGRAAIEEARGIVELLATTATVAIDGLERRRTVREQEGRLADREQRLRRITRVAEVVRGVDRALVRSTTLDAVRSSVTAALTADDRLAFAWIGAVDGGTIEPLATSGDDSGYLAAVPLADDEGPVEPAVEAATTGEVIVASNVADGLSEAAWRREAISRELQSVLSVPLVHGEVSYGVLTAYANRPDAFGDLERAVFAELGETIGNETDAIATRERLLGDSVVELEFVLGDDDGCLLADVADATGGEIAFNGVVPATETTTRLYLTVRGVSTSALEEAVTGTPGVESMRIVTTRSDQHLIEVVVAGRTIPAMVVDRGASVRSLTVDDEGVRVVVDLPAAGDVRAFTERFGTEFASAEFVARRERDRPIQRQQGFRSSLEERLTDRQREVLETAYYSGLYASPRRCTVGEIADAIGVSQPTVTEHLRSAQSKLLDLVFADDPTTG